MIQDTRSLAARLIAASPLALSIAEARAQTQDRRRKLLAPPPVSEPDIAPEPLPVVDALADYARDFWKDNQPIEKPTPRGRKKSEPSKKRRSPFRVIKGGKDGDKES